MAKNKGQNNANDMKSNGMTNDTDNRANMQTQSKSDNKKGSTGKSKNSGAQG